MSLKDYPGAQPLWAQLYDILLERILTGVYPLDETLPTDKDLIEEFQVSRITVRNAMDKLINEGFIIRQRGVGSKVIKDKKDEELLSTVLKSSYDFLEEDTKEKRLKSVEMVQAPDKVRKFFQLDAKSEVLMLQREVMKGEKVVGIHHTYLSPKLPIEKEFDFNGSLYKQINKLGFTLTQAEEKITSNIISEQEKTFFNTSDIESVLRRERKVCFNQLPLEYTISVYLGKEYSLNINLT